MSASVLGDRSTVVRRGTVLVVDDEDSVRASVRLLNEGSIRLGRCTR